MGNGTLLIVAVIGIAVVGYLYLGGSLQTGMGGGVSAASYSGGGIALASPHSGGGAQTGASEGGKRTGGTEPSQSSGLAYLLIAPALVGLGGAISKKKWGTYNIFSRNYRLIELTAEPPKLEFREKEATTQLTVKFNRKQQRGKPVEFRIADTHGNPVHACLFKQGEQMNGQEKLEVTGTQTGETVHAQLKATGDENMAVQVCATVKQWGLGKGPHACITLSKEGMAASETGRPQIVIKLQAQDTPVEIVAADNKHAKALLAKIKKETGSSSPILVAKTTSDLVTAEISLQHGNIRIPPDKYRLKVADVKPNQDGTYTLQGSGMYVIRARYKGTNLKQALYLMKTEKKGGHKTKQDAPADSGDAQKKQQETTQVPTEEPKKEGVTFMAALFDGNKGLATAEPVGGEDNRCLLSATVTTGNKLKLWVHANKADGSELAISEYTVTLRGMEDEQEIIPTKQALLEHELSANEWKVRYLENHGIRFPASALLEYEIDVKEGEGEYWLNATHGEQQYACLVSITGKGVNESDRQEGEDELKNLFDGNQATLVFETAEDENGTPKNWSPDKNRKITSKKVHIRAIIDSEQELPPNVRLQLLKNKDTKLDKPTRILLWLDTLEKGTTKYTALVYGKGRFPATYSEITLTLKEEGKEEKNSVKGTFTLKVGEEQTIIDPAAPPKPAAGDGGLHTVALRNGDKVQVSLEFSGTGKYNATLKADGKDKPLTKKGNAYECTLKEEDLGNKESTTFALSVYEEKTRYLVLPTKDHIFKVDNAIYLKKHQAKRNRNR